MIYREKAYFPFSAGILPKKADLSSTNHVSCIFFYNITVFGWGMLVEEGPKIQQ